MADKRRRRGDMAKRDRENAEPSHSLVAVRRQEFSGPLPSPDSLAQYEEILPGAAERILAMAESEQAQRHQNESRQIEGLVTERHRGQIFGFLIALLAIMLAGFMLWRGFPLYSLATFFTAMVPLIGAFLYKRRAAKPSDSGSPDTGRSG